MFFSIAHTPALETFAGLREARFYPVDTVRLPEGVRAWQWYGPVASQAASTVSLERMKKRTAMGLVAMASPLTGRFLDPHAGSHDRAPPS